jgi:flavin-dependent dehydrogenase
VESSVTHDVAIIGGGPAGSTAATLLRKYNPGLRVLVLEKEKFPREHIGESQLPPIGVILNEMGVWDKVEAANFPVKIGASFTWGRTMDRWDFDFYPVERWQDQPRPATWEGQRRFTAFQVERSIFDDILLRHAESMGAQVREQAQVRRVLSDEDRVTGLELDGGGTVSARWYVDASGQSGILRRAMGVGEWIPGELKNIATWDYWENAEWAVHIGVGATRIQVRSLPWGWIWFIPLGPTRTSIGVVCPAERYKSSGLTPEALYAEGLRLQPEIGKLIRNATPSGTLRSCKDWSQLSDRLVGENWFIVGDAAGFADPILSAGMTLSMTSARDCAYTIMELDRGEHDSTWLRNRFDERNRTNIRQHIRFGQYWYSANSCFTELQDHCRRIAADAGLKLTPQQAWAWLCQGGFTSEHQGLPTFGSFDVSSAKRLLDRFDPQGRKARLLIDGYNVFKLNLRGAVKTKAGELDNGRIRLVDCYERGTQRLPLVGYYDMMVRILERTDDVATIYQAAMQTLRAIPGPEAAMDQRMAHAFAALELMIESYWVERGKDARRPMLHASLDGSRYIRSAEETAAAVAATPDAPRIVFNI